MLCILEIVKTATHIDTVSHDIIDYKFYFFYFDQALAVDTSHCRDKNDMSIPQLPSPLTWLPASSADVLHGRQALPRAQVDLERAAKQLEQDLEARLCDCLVVAALAQLVADEGVLRPRELVPAEDDAGGAHLGADQVAAGVGHVRVLDAEDHGHLAPERAQVVDRVLGAGGPGRGGVGRGVRA